MQPMAHCNLVNVEPTQHPISFNLCNPYEMEVNLLRPPRPKLLISTHLRGVWAWALLTNCELCQPVNALAYQEAVSKEGGGQSEAPIATAIEEINQIAELERRQNDLCASK